MRYLNTSELAEVQLNVNGVKYLLYIEHERKTAVRQPLESINTLD